MIKGLDHVAIAVSDLEEAVRLWTSQLGAVVVHRETVASQGVTLVMLRLGELKIELLSPTSDNSPIAKFLAKRGPGIHHLAVLSDSTQAELDRISERGALLIDDRARAGAEHSQVGFLHPKTLGGVLVEIVERPNHGA